MINIGKYIEIVINWMTEHWAHFFDVINNIIGGFIETFQHGLLWIPFYIMIPALAVLAWYKAGKGTAVLTLLGKASQLLHPGINRYGSKACAG